MIITQVVTYHSSVLLPLLRKVVRQTTMLLHMINLHTITTVQHTHTMTKKLLVDKHTNTTVPSFQSNSKKKKRIHTNESSFLVLIFVVPSVSLVFTYIVLVAALSLGNPRWKIKAGPSRACMAWHDMGGVLNEVRGPPAKNKEKGGTAQWRKQAPI